MRYEVISSLKRLLRWYVGLLMLSSALTVSAQYTNGIYAEFNTSMGSFTCRLDHAMAPKAVANFIGLATGARAWLDVPTGQVRTDPFYNGTTFHRVIAGFMNQGGSRNGQGTDGPGYQFLDEFNPNALHDGFGVLSMANSGPDSNGSQFFVTVSPQPHLNGVHTVFGRLHGGSNVVYAINNVATNGSAKPLVDVVLTNVLIRRVGPDAEAFNIHGCGLPSVTNLSLAITRSGSSVSLTFSNKLNVENRIYGSTNLQTWSGTSLRFETALPLVNSLLLSPVRPAEFFKATQVQYQDSLFTPRNVFNRSMTLNFSSGLRTSIVFDGVGSGSYTNHDTGFSGGVFYSWTQDPYRGRFRPLILNGFGAVEIHLDYDTPNSGTFRGGATGTFASSP